MSVAKSIKTQVESIHPGKPFTNSCFLKLGSRPAVDKAMSRLVEAGTIKRVAHGVFVRPKKSHYVDSIMPNISQVIEAIAKDNGEVIQVHGAEAARRFKISTQMPTQPVYYTNGSSREIQIGKLKVKLIHTSNHRKLQHVGKKTGLALIALWYLGKKQVTVETISHIHNGLSTEEFAALRNTDMPQWMKQIIENYCKNIPTNNKRST